MRNSDSHLPFQQVSPLNLCFYYTCTCILLLDEQDKERELVEEEFVDKNEPKSDSDKIQLLRDG